MVKAVFGRNMRGEIDSLKLNGHAEYSPGMDIVCASISGLCFAIAGSLNNVKTVKLIFRQDVPGDMLIKIENVSLGLDQVRVAAIFNTAVIGLLQIELSYPENLTVEGVRDFKKRLPKPFR